MKRFQRRRGFTLIELIVVLVILAILAAAGLPALSGYIKSARETTAISECSTVVRTAQAKAAELLAFGKLEDLPSKTDSIMDACGLPGELLGVSADTVSGSVSYLLYQTKNGLVVRYDPAKEPKFVVLREGENGGGTLPPQTALEAMISNTQAWMNTFDKDKAFDRQELAKWAMQPENLQQVDAALLNGWSPAGNVAYPFYWRPYHLNTLDGKNQNPKEFFLFAAPTASNAWNGWSAYIFYVNGKVYRREDGKSLGIAGFSNYKTAAEVEARIIAEGFVLVTG